MIKPLVGHASIHIGMEVDPIPRWHEALASASASAESLVKLLVDIAAWAQRHPDSAAANTLLGDAYLKVKQPYAAEKAFRTALGRDPKQVRAREGLGLALLQTNRLDDAVKHLGVAHKLDPANAEVLVHWGLALVQKDNLKAAYKRFQMALECDPGNASAQLNLGIVDTRRGVWHSAVDHFQKALTLKPAFAEALHNLALAFRHVGNLEKALSTAEDLAIGHPQNTTHWVLLAELRLNAGQLEPAHQAIQRAIGVDPGNPAIYLTQAALYAARRQYTDAEGLLKTALVLSRDNPDIQLEMGHLQLLLGRFESGWDLHEARKLIAQSPVRRTPLPDWQGEDLSQQAVLVHAEQGLGDTIMFAHCLPDLLSQAGHVVLEVSAKIAPLFTRSFPDASIVTRDAQVADLDWANRFSPPIRHQISIGSLPRHFRRNANKFQPHSGYLRADPERIAYWRQQLSQFRRPVVGLTWRGGLVQTGREQRSLHLKEWASMLRACPVQWISLQYGESAAQEAADASFDGLHLPHWAETLRDQDDVAALTCALDTVVTVCSTQAHLTGALGRPGLVLTPFNANWRYGCEGDTMCWYPSLRLLRQQALGDWSHPLEALRQHLENLASAQQ